MRLWEEIVAAQARIQKAIRQTPVIYSETFSKETGKAVFLKLENLQKAGSFKIRGAYNKLSHLSPSSKKKGVVAASAGNHAQGVALASSLLGIRATMVMPEGASLAKQMATEVKIRPTLADGIALRSLGEINFPIVQKYVDDIVTVKEEEIASAILMLMERKRVVAEGAGAVPLAALLSRKHQIAAKKVVLVISGGNIDVNLLDRIIEKGLSETGRIVRFGVLVRDVPGPLAQLSGLIAENHANILHVIHERASRDIPIGLTKVIMVLETRGPDPIRKIRNVLKGTGYPIQMMS